MTNIGVISMSMVGLLALYVILVIAVLLIVSYAVLLISEWLGGPVPTEHVWIVVLAVTVGLMASRAVNVNGSSTDG